MAQLSVEEARARVLDGVEPLSAEMIAIGAAHGRVLSADLAALRSQPAEAVSAMDGYAVRAADLATLPATLRVIGEAAAGQPFVGTVGQGETARIFTGGVLPAGADAVVLQEHSERRGAEVVIRSSPAVGKHVRSPALDFARGAVVLRKGRRLSDRDLALAAGMNYPTVAVHRRPKLAILATGDELVVPGSELTRGQVVYSNGFAIAALARQEGAEVVDFGIVPDRIEPTVAAIEQVCRSGADILVTTGGASVGDHDLVKRSLEIQGMELAFWKVAMRPGRPLIHGRIGATFVLGLPGNPVSSYVGAFLFLIPLLRRLCGRGDLLAPLESAVLGCDLGENDERTDYLRAQLDARADGTLVATPFDLQDSSLLVPLAKADCFVVREPYAAAAQSGTQCRIIKLGP
jgi:molybdopterin molybdotransferase